MNLKYIFGDKKGIFKILMANILLSCVKYFSSRDITFLTKKDLIAYFFGGLSLEDVTGILSMTSYILYIIAVIGLISLPIVDEIKEIYIYVVTRKVKKSHIVKMIFLKSFVYSLVFSLFGYISVIVFSGSLVFTLEILLIHFLMTFSIVLFAILGLILIDAKISLPFIISINVVPYIFLGFFKKSTSVEFLKIFRIIPFTSGNYNFYNSLSFKFANSVEKFDTEIIPNNNAFIVIYQILFIFIITFLIYICMKKEWKNGN